MAHHSLQSLEQSRLHLVPGAGVGDRCPCVVIVGAGFACLTRGKTVPGSFAAARRYTHAAIVAAPGLGHGPSITSSYRGMNPLS